MPIGTRVLMLVENLPVPSDRRVWAEATALREHGYQVSVICPKGSTTCREAHACLDGVEIYRYALPATGSGGVAYLVEYACALLATLRLSVLVWRRHGFDILHAANPPDLFFLVGLAYRLAGKRFIYDQHDLAPELFEVLFGARFRSRFGLPWRLLGSLMCRLEVWSYRTADAVIVTNGSQRANALTRGRVAARNVFVVRNGPHPVLLQAPDPEPSPLPDHRYLLAYVGVMGRQDGVEQALYALREVLARRKCRDVGLVLIGAGSELPELRQLAERLGLARDVCFTGWLRPEEVARTLSRADVGVVPDPRSPLNERSTLIKVLDYMAMGKPIVAFDLPETRVSAGAAALYATPNRVEELAGHIQALLANESLRQEMGAIGRQRIQRGLSWEHTSLALIQAYEHVRQPASEWTHVAAAPHGAPSRQPASSTMPE
jgi:glycosyltransferase involved in cell wall biosynthesis